jgi:hypothetical protein
MGLASFNKARREQVKQAPKVETQEETPKQKTTKK